MTVRLIYEQALAGALAGWIGYDLADRLVPALGGSGWMSGGLIGGAIGFLVLVPAVRGSGGGRVARSLVLGAVVGGIAGAVGFGFPFGLLVVPQVPGVLIGGLAVGTSLGLVQGRSLIGLGSGILGGLIGGPAMAALPLLGIDHGSIGAACLGGGIGLGLALPGRPADNSPSASFREIGATG